ncbi:MAG: hypothetical protein ABFD12_02880, partial [Syntrophorhabdus sp.]
MRKTLPSGESIVEQTIKDKAEVKILENRGEFREGLDAGRKIDALQVQEQARLQEIADLYLCGVPYERERIVGEISIYLKQAVTGFIEAGRR